MRVIKQLLQIVIFVRLTCTANSSWLGTIINQRQLSLIEFSMDMAADPCEDFYQHSCGKWEENLDGAGDKFYDTLSMLDYRVNRDMSDYMQRLRLRNAPRFVRIAYEYYTSCIDIGQYKPLEYLRWMKNHEGIRWPDLRMSPKTNVEFDWVLMLATMRRYGMNDIFIEEAAVQQKYDRTKQCLNLDKPVEDGGFVSLTEENLKVIIESLGVPMQSSTFQKLWREVSDFEQLLEKLDDIEDDVGNQLINVTELPLKWLEKYLLIILNQSSLDANMELYIQNIPYMEALDALLQQYESRFICKYLEIRFLWFLYVKGSRNLSLEDCISSARSLLPLAMHWIYEQQHPEMLDEIPRIEELYASIMKTFNQSLAANRYDFNATTQEYLLNKLSSIQLKVGNLPRIDTITVLEDFFKGVTLNVSNFYGNHLQLMKLHFNASHASLRNTPTHNASEYFHVESYYTGSSLSPYFIKRSNIVIVPMPLLERPFYHEDYDDIYKYSSLGFVLAHEILHGFDYSRLVEDGNGRYNTEQYDNILSNSQFDHSYNCLRNLNPTVIDEKIADVSGLRYSYESYFTLFPEALNRTRRIHGSEMSLKKVFFLNFAQYFCGSADDFVNTNQHGKDSDRVNDALSHFPEFAKTYECSEQSRMRPSQTCHLWRR